jgi:hypothetical protein
MAKFAQGASPSVYTSPILFSPPMVRALRDNRKSQTRRLITSQWSNVKMHHELGERCLLWARETWADVNTENGPAFLYKAGGLHFCVDDAYPVEYERYPGMQFTMWCGDLERGEPGHCWRSPFHMPRWASRLTLELVNARIQKLHDISEEDAIAEGIDRDPQGHGWMDYRPTDEYRYFINPIDSYQSLWQTLHGADSWAANPEIIAFTCCVHHRNVDGLISSREAA